MGAEDEPPASSEDSEPPPPAEEPEDAFGRVNVLDYLDTTHLVALLCVAFGAVCWLALRWKKERACISSYGTTWRSSSRSTGIACSNRHT